MRRYDRTVLINAPQHRLVRGFLNIHPYGENLIFLRLFLRILGKTKSVLREELKLCSELIKFAVSLSSNSFRVQMHGI